MCRLENRRKLESERKSHEETERVVNLLVRDDLSYGIEESKVRDEGSVLLEEKKFTDDRGFEGKQGGSVGVDGGIDYLESSASISSSLQDEESLAYVSRVKQIETEYRDAYFPEKADKNLVKPCDRGEENCYKPHQDGHLSDEVMCDGPWYLFVIF